MQAEAEVEPGPARDPVIVTGAPRTGVRLLAAILDAHPAFASGPDLPFLATLVRQWQTISSELGPNHARHHGIPLQASRAAFRSAALEIFAPRLRRTGKGRFVLQTFTAAVLLQPFAELFPSARFVLMIRDPQDVVRSLLRCDWLDAHNGQPLAYTRDPEAAARFATEFMSAALESARALGAAGRLMVLPYEALATEPQAALARVGAFLRESPPRASVLPDSAALVAESPDNPHPRLRVGGVDRSSVRSAPGTLELGDAREPMNRLRAELGYRDVPQEP